MEISFQLTEEILPHVATMTMYLLVHIQEKLTQEADTNGSPSFHTVESNSKFFFKFLCLVYSKLQTMVIYTSISLFFPEMISLMASLGLGFSMGLAELFLEEYFNLRTFILIFYSFFVFAQVSSYSDPSE